MHNESENNSKIDSLSYMLSGANVLIAGGAGLLGTNLVLRLQGYGANVTATFHNRLPQFSADHVNYTKTDLTQMADCLQVTQNIDYMFICASSKFSAGLAHLTPAHSVAQSVVMTANLLDAASRNGVKKVAYTSSAAVYSGIDGDLTENVPLAKEPTANLFYYSNLKRFCETLCEMYVKNSDGKMSIVAVRPSSVYGPYDDFNLETAYVMAALICKAVENNRPLEVWGNGNTSRNFIFVDDVIDIMLLSMAKTSGFEAINAATNSTITIRDLTKYLLSLSGEDLSAALFNTSKPDGNVIANVSTEKLEKFINYTPKTSLAEGVKKTMTWYKNHFE